MWLIAFSFLIFGPSVWAIKFVAALFGILSVFGLYLLTKEILRATKYELQAKTIALISAFFLAISFWHTNFSRIGFRAIMVPFFLVFAFYFLFRGFHSKKIFNFIISGIFFGFGFYTYISYRFVVLLLPAVLVSWFFIYRKEKNVKKFFLFAVFCLLFTVICALPIGIYFLKHPQDFLGRATGVSVFSQPNLIKNILKSLAAHLGMFNFYGDQNWRHNFSESPMLSLPIGILFLIGIILSIKDLIVSIKNKKWQMFTAQCFLWFWFFTMLLSGILSYEGIPHSLRVVGVIPVVNIFAGFGAFFLYEKLKTLYKTKLQIIGFSLIIFVFLTAVAYSEFDKYFFQWAENNEVRGAFSENCLKIGEYLNSLPENLKKYVVVNQGGVPVPWPNGLSMPAQTPIFIERTEYGKTRAEYLLPENINQIKIDKTEETMIVFMEYDENLFKDVWEKFPGGEFQEKEGFWIFKINS